MGGLGGLTREAPGPRHSNSSLPLPCSDRLPNKGGNGVKEKDQPGNCFLRNGREEESLNCLEMPLAADVYYSKQFYGQHEKCPKEKEFLDFRDQ